MQLTRRTLLASGAAAGAVQTLPRIAAQGSGRRILTLVYDKALGAMRAVERIVP